MIEHSCCCIWDFVMSGLNQIQFGFENPLKIGFEKFEKEKEKGNFLLRAAILPWPSARPTAATHPFFPRARLWISWAEPKPRPAGPSSRVRSRPAPSR
jgi:hypothetical protein